MKKLLTICMVAVAAVCVARAQDLSADKLQWTDATSLTVRGRITAETYEPYSRLPQSLEGVARKPVWELGRHSAGVYVKFVSDAPAMSLRWTAVFDRSSDNMSDINTKGLDLYVWSEGRWQYLGTARPKSGGPVYVSDFFFDKLGEGRHEFLVYLSSYDGVKRLEVGIPDGCWIEPSTFNSPRTSRPVIMYGTSILQGGSAARPGLIGTNRLSRMLDRQVINLGFSGNARLDYEIARLMADCPDPGVYVLDNLPNCNAELVRERQEAFYRILRESHPDVPVVFVECPYFARCKFSSSQEKIIRDKNEALREVFESLRKSGEKHIYYVKGERLLDPDGEGTIDGSHFTEEGFAHYISALYPVLRKICDKF